MMAFATSTAIVDDDGTANSTYEENTYSLYKKDAASDSEDSIAFTQSASLDTATGNGGDKLRLVSEVPAVPLVTALYYEGQDVTTADTATDTNAKVLFDKDWNVQTGFTTGTFAVAVSGSTADAEQTISVDITATPFYLNGVTSSVYGGTVSITVSGATNGSGTYAADSDGADATTVSDDTSQVSFGLAKNTYYDGYAGTSDTIGHANGIITDFTIVSALPSDSRTLPSGRYVSTVTLAYSID
jgi:hypothetical protein